MASSDATRGGPARARQIDWSGVVGGLAGIALAVVVYVTSLSFPGASTGPSGPSFFPQVVALVMGLASALIVVNGLRGSRPAASAAQGDGQPGAEAEQPDSAEDVDPEAGAARAKTTPASTAGRLWIVLIASAVYPVAMTWLGYILSTFLFTWLLALAMQARRRWIASALVAAALVATSYVTFAVLLRATLPAGRLF